MNVQSIPHFDILHVIASGDFSIPEAQRTFLEVLDVIQQLRLQKVLFDGRGVGGEPTVIERFYYGDFAARSVKELGKHGWNRAEPRFAYVLWEPVLDPLRLGETVAVNRGMKVKAFDNRESAIEWLNAGAGAIRDVERKPNTEPRRSS